MLFFNFFPGSAVLVQLLLRVIGKMLFSGSEIHCLPRYIIPNQVSTAVVSRYFSRQRNIPDFVFDLRRIGGAANRETPSLNFEWGCIARPLLVPVLRVLISAVELRWILFRMFSTSGLSAGQKILDKICFSSGLSPDILII